MAGTALIFASTKETILHAIILSSTLLLLFLSLSSLLSLVYILLLLLSIVFHNSRMLLSLSISAFSSLSLSIILADKSFSYSIQYIDLPNSYPLLISISLSSLSLLLSHLLLLLSNSVFLVFHLSQFILLLSLPFSFLSPSFLSISLLSSSNIYRFPIFISDLLGRFRAMNIIFFRSELSLIIVFVILYISHNEIITS